MLSFTATVEKAVVRYSYNADNEDELSLKENDIIVILDKELEDAGWWKGELNGKVGVFPDNFVELIQAEEVNFKKIYNPKNHCARVIFSLHGYFMQTAVLQVNDGMFFFYICKMMDILV